MWYLVVPPIVVVLSLFFLLWYLLRKGEDPVIAQKVRESEKEARVLLPGVKEFFLKSVEKLAQRFKVGLLRAHNILNEFTQSVKKMRTKAEVTLPLSSKESQAGQPVFSREETVSADVVDSVKETSGEAVSYGVSAAPIVRREREERQTVTLSPQEAKGIVPRPTISESMTHPELQKNGAKKESPREESLIGRIARDPKDFTAYEELGDHYLEIGNIKDAKECYRQVLKLSPVHRLVKIKIRRLEKLLTRGRE
ncbi:MAG: hypothetical protein KBD27_02635 [Candidatus Moranbacteria bacterium]|nr:hypothetical protein [Candidatus Moranbacteria bacterium]